MLDLGTSGSQQTGSSLGLSLQEAGVRQGSRPWCCTDAVVVSYVCLLLLLKPAPGIERLHVSSHCRHPTSSRRRCRPCPDLIRPSKARDPSLVPPRPLHCLAILQPRLYFLAHPAHARCGLWMPPQLLHQDEAQHREGRVSRQLQPCESPRSRHNNARLTRLTPTFTIRLAGHRLGYYLSLLPQWRVNN